MAAPDSVQAASDGAQLIAASTILIKLLLGGLMGTIGQSVRAVAGLKKLNDYSSAGSQDVFVASRLIVSLLIGFIAGAIAGITTGFVMGTAGISLDLLLGLAAAGYVGVDFIEAMASSVIGKSNLQSIPPQAPTPQVPQATNLAGQKPPAAPSQPLQAAPSARVAQAALVLSEPVALPGTVNAGAEPLSIQDIRKNVLQVAGQQYPDQTPITKILVGAADPIWTFAGECMNNSSQFKSDGLILEPNYVDYHCKTVGDFVNCIQWCYQHPGLAKPGS